MENTGRIEAREVIFGKFGIRIVRIDRRLRRARSNAQRGGFVNSSASGRGLFLTQPLCVPLSLSHLLRLTSLRLAL